MFEVKCQNGDKLYRLVLTEKEYFSLKHLVYKALGHSDVDEFYRQTLHRLAQTDFPLPKPDIDK